MEALVWHTEQRKYKDLVPFEFNPRILTDDRKEKLIRSLTKFGMVEIPTINIDNTLLAGHQRVKCAIELGWGEELIDVRVPNRELTEHEIKEYNLVSNVSIGFWDIDILELNFGDIDFNSIGLDLSSIELPEILTEAKEEKENDFEIKLPINPVSQCNDVIEFHSLDKKLVHRIMCGSSTDRDNMSLVFIDEKADLIVTDPPYNVNYTGGTKDKMTIQNDNMSSDQFYKFLFDSYQNMHDNTKEGGAIYVFHADTEGANFRKAFIDVGFKLSQCLIWVKNSSIMSRQDYHWMHEPILYGWKKGAAHEWYSDRTQKTVIEWDRPIRNDEHPTMKPVGLIEYFINNSSKRFQIVADFFSGSGTTFIGCEKNKRHFRGFELDPIFMDVNVRRWHTYMIDNGLDFKIIRNGHELSEENIKEYYSRVA